METKMYNLESLKIKDDEIQLYPNFIKTSPFMLLEDKISILYFDEGILYLNIKTGQYEHFKLRNYLNDENTYNNFYFCILENNKFIIYFNNFMNIYIYKKRKLNIIFCKTFNKETLIDTIFKLFNEKYILIQFKNHNFQIFFESKSNSYENIFEFNNSNIINLTPIDNFKKPDEIYFYGKNNKDFIIQFKVNSKNEINFNLKNLTIIGEDYKFITDEKLLIKYRKRKNYSYLTKYIVYDLKNNQIENVIDNKNLLKNIFKRIKGKYELVLKEILYYSYGYDYFILERNKDEIIFIQYPIYYGIFKIFKYTYNNNLAPITKEKEEQFNKNNEFCISF